MTAARPRPTVVKVGGSLLDWPELPARLARDLTERPGPLVLVVGGGGAADFVRRQDRIFQLGEERSHRLALHALDLTTQLVAELIDAVEVVDRLGALAACWAAGRTPILAPRRFLDEDEAGAFGAADPLPHTWGTTTDSIAARVADRLGGADLVLLKSVSLPDGVDRAAAARLGLVDPVFPMAARRLARVSFRNIRDPLGLDRILHGSMKLADRHPTT